MVPLPGRVHNLISGPLQTWSTTGTVFLLELFGVTVGREGNVIVLNDVQHVAIAEACSGLRMLTAFVVVAAVLAYIVNRPRWQKLTLVVSSVPIAVVCNLGRLVLTAVLYLVVSSTAAERFFHDFAGISMMPLAVLLLLAELKLMAWLVTPDQPAKPTAAAGGRT
jgi:exosortase